MTKIRNRRIIGLLLTVAMVLSLGAVMMIPAAAVKTFPDVPSGKYYAKAVSYCAEQGLVTGYEDGNFRPDNPLKRIEMAVIMAKMLKLTEKAENTFTDVKASAWYAGPVLQCVKAGVMTGTGNKQFGVSQTVTREMGAVILAKALGVKAETGRTSFADDAKISSWAAGSVRAMTAKGLISGTGSNMFSPKLMMTRAQMCQIIYMARAGEEEPEPSEEPEPDEDETATVTAPALVKSVQVYDIDHETKEWTEQRKIDYYYKDKYPTQITTTYADEDIEEPVIGKYEYTFKDGVPESRGDYDVNGELQHTMEYLNGNAYRYRIAGEEDNESVWLFQYSDSGPYFSLLLMDNRFPGEVDEEVDSIQVYTRDSGLLKKTVNSGVYANWLKDEPEEKEWQRFNGTYTANYDVNGILSDTSAVYRAGPSGAQEAVEVTVKDGKVTEIIVSQIVQGQAPLPMEKFVFEYTDVTIEPVRYSMMINDIIFGDNLYYKYNWY